MNSDLEREFYCTLKLVSGEEIVSLIMVDDTDALDPLIILQEPIVIQYSTQGAFSQIKLEPWLKTTEEDIFFIRLSKVITMTEIYDIDLINLYTDFNDQKNELKEEREEYEEDIIDKSQAEKNISKKMGFLGTISETKKSLEDLFKKDIKDNTKEL
tara:strand:+ start:7360 stop:7827 length:468 start_codon:yes stop_codon:yes gene_type:complete